MKKYAPVLFIFILFTVSGKASANSIPPILSVSGVFEVVPELNDEITLNSMLGLGMRLPFLFGDGDLGFMLAPALAVEYGFSANLLRLRGGLHIGLLKKLDSLFFDYYIGVSGIYMQDFTNNIPVAGISPEIGVEVYIPYFPNMRVQLQYDFLSVERYNRFGCTISFIFPLKKPDFHY